MKNQINIIIGITTFCILALPQLAFSAPNDQVIRSKIFCFFDDGTNAKLVDKDTKNDVLTILLLRDKDKAYLMDRITHKNFINDCLEVFGRPANNIKGMAAGIGLGEYVRSFLPIRVVDEPLEAAKVSPQQWQALKEGLAASEGLLPTIAYPVIQLIKGSTWAAKFLTTNPLVQTAIGSAIIIAQVFFSKAWQLYAPQIFTWIYTTLGFAAAGPEYLQAFELFKSIINDPKAIGAGIGGWMAMSQLAKLAYNWVTTPNVVYVIQEVAKEAKAKNQ